jgi:type IV pilus assembly protein PilV
METAPMRTPHRLRRRASRPGAAARGFTLIESLVALLVLSIGLLGVAAMQLASLQANNGAFQRTQATFLAQDIADRMRANRTAAIAEDYDFALGDAAPVAPATIAEQDIVAWKARLAATLPQGAVEPPDAAIDVDPATGVALITVVWDDSKGEEDLLTFDMRTRL